MKEISLDCPLAKWQVSSVLSCPCGLLNPAWLWLAHPPEVTAEVTVAGLRDLW